MSDRRGRLVNDGSAVDLRPPADSTHGFGEITDLDLGQSPCTDSGNSELTRSARSSSSVRSAEGNFGPNLANQSSIEASSAPHSSASTVSRASSASGGRHKAQNRCKAQVG